MTLKLTYAGFNYVADVDGSYADATSLSTLVSQTGSNSVELMADYGIDAATNTVYADYSSGGSTGSTESIADITAQAQAAKAAGLSVVIRPLIDFLPDATSAMLTSNGNTYTDPDWRVYYNAGTVAQGISFLQSYEQTVLLPLAQVAQNVGAQVFDIGTEIDQFTGPAYQAEWDTIISDVKAIYTGKLTYSAIGDDDLSPWAYGNYADANITNPAPVGTGDITTQVSFWNKLDYVGIDEYSALSNLNDTAQNGSTPTLQQLVNAWEQPFTDDGNGTPTDTTADQTNGQSLIQYYESIATATGKPLLFTELGYNSAPDAASQPFFTNDSNNPAYYDPALQAELYQAFFQAWKADGNTSLNGVWFWNWEPDGSTVGAGTIPSWTPQGNTTALSETDTAFTAAESPACYAAATRILTVRGEIAVEALQAGDLVATFANCGSVLKPVRWLGHRRMKLGLSTQPENTNPVRFRAGALGEGLPHRDLLVSPNHRMRVDDTLVTAVELVNGASIVQECPNEIEYWHIELDGHDLVLAEGVQAETYQDVGNRDAFENGGVVALSPVLDGDVPEPCLPYAGASSAVRARLIARAETLGWTCSIDPAPWLEMDGQRVEGSRCGEHWRFEVQAACQEIRLRSRAGRPWDVDPHSGDRRELGLKLHRLALSGPGGVFEVALDSPQLAQGFNAVEHDEIGWTWRWTNGDAMLSLAELAPGQAVTGVEIAFDQALPMWIAPDAVCVDGTVEAQRLSRLA
jgi:hypothetical protein